MSTHHATNTARRRAAVRSATIISLVTGCCILAAVPGEMRSKSGVSSSAVYAQAMGTMTSERRSEPRKGERGRSVSVEALVSPGGVSANRSTGPGSLTTGFEPGEGFAPGPILGQAGWSAFQAAPEGHIDTVNPAAGSQHLRISKDPSLPTLTDTGAFSPVLGPLATGPSTTSVDVAISATGGADYFVIGQSPSEGFKTWQVGFGFQGQILVLDDVGAGLVQVDTGATWTVGPYQNLSVCDDPVAGTTDYYYNGVLIYSQVTHLGGTRVEQVVLLSDNFHTTDDGDFDNLSIQAGLLGTCATGACCTADNQCLDGLNQETCEVEFEGSFAGNETTCAGDGEGIDDACRTRVIVQVLVSNIDALTLASTSAANPEDGAVADADLAEAIDTSVQAMLGDLAPFPHDVNRTYDTIPFVALSVSDGALSFLENSPAVLGITEDSLAEPTLNNTVNIVGASAVWATGFDGTGWHVAILDTGILPTHNFFTGKNIVQACFASGQFQTSPGDCPNGTATQIGGNAAQHYAGTFAGWNHGTHVTGIATGNDPTFGTSGLSGVGRGADIMAVQVFSRFTNGCQGGVSCVLSFTSDQIAGLNYVFSQRFNFNIASVNMSLEGGNLSNQATCDTQNAGTKAAIDLLRAVGIATVIASGNGAFCTGISSPGCISSAIAVGAVDDLDNEASFSNWDPSNLLDLYAPGVAVFSSNATGNSNYISMSGTSMATPHVAGAWAILKQANPGASVQDILGRLQSTGQTVNGRGSPCATTPPQRRIQINAALRGACCDASTGGCTSVIQTNCQAPLQWTAGVLCANLSPPCTGQGACPPPFEWGLAATAGPTQRWGHAMAYAVQDRLTVMFGGQNTDEVWVWDGQFWDQRVPPGPSPAGRTRTAMAYDSTQRRVVIFGGQDAVGYFGDTWAYDVTGDSWDQISAGGPSARASHAMVYDQQNNQILLFGGKDANGAPLDDTWALNLNLRQWRQLAPTNSPSARAFHAMAYDSIRRVTVLYSGGGNPGSGETWELQLDGINPPVWTQAFPTSNPGFRSGHKMAFDSTRGVTVVYGGNVLDRNLGTWEWDGVNWNEVVTSGDPGPRSEFAMTYDAARGQTVLFGGVTIGGVSDETWVFPAESTRQLFLLTGPANGTGWSWSVTDSSTFDVFNLSPPVTSGTAVAFAQLFVDSINDAGCPGIDAVVPGFDATALMNVNTGIFQVTVSGTQSFDICCGPPWNPNACCVPTNGQCTCNPTIEEITLSGEDCNRNGIDDAGDIASGISQDLNGNGVPDECEAGPGVNPPQVAPPPHNIRKNRYLSFDPNNPSTPVAFKVELTDQVCSLTGKECTTTADCKVCIGGSNNGQPCSFDSNCPGGGSCNLSGGTCDQQSNPVALGWVSEPLDPSCQNLNTGQPLAGTPPCVGVDYVSRVVSTPVFRVWPEPVIHVGDCEVAPGFTYAITAVATSSASFATTLADVSPAAEVGVSAQADRVEELTPPAPAETATPLRWGTATSRVAIGADLQVGSSSPGSERAVRQATQYDSVNSPVTFLFSIAVDTGSGNGVSVFDTLGDDYVTNSGLPFQLEEFVFAGGVDNDNEVAFFDFFDDTGAFVDSLGVQLPQGGTFIWTITITTPFVVPGSGFVSMRTDDGTATVDSSGVWFSADQVLVGANDPDSMVVDLLIENLLQPSAPNILAWEMRGTNLASSAPLELGTIEEPQGKFWGDVVGNFDGMSWSEPNLLVNVDDVVALLSFLTLKPGRPHVTVLDLEPEVPNWLINATDLQLVLAAFGGAPYPPPGFPTHVCEGGSDDGQLCNPLTTPPDCPSGTCTGFSPTACP